VVSREYSTEDVRRRAPEVVVVEALGASFFTSGHIPEAINIPPHRVRDTAPVLLPDKDVPVVVYGASPACQQAEIVVRILLALGYRNVSKYPDGKEGWAAAGLPLVTSESDVLPARGVNGERPVTPP
jgi:rhodanese-related sulfurtransferase